MLRKRALLVGIFLLFSILLNFFAFAEVKLSGEGITIGYTTADTVNEYWVTVKNAAEEEAKRLGVNLVHVPTQGDQVSKQLDIINDFIAQKVDAVIISAVDSEGIVPGIKKLNDAGIPVIGTDVIPAGGDMIAKVWVDPYYGGTLVGKYILDELGPNGKLFIIDPTSYAEIIDIRLNGGRDILEENGWTTIRQAINPYGRPQAIELTETVLLANPDIKAIYTLNDDMALGSVQATMDSGQNDILVVGYDALPEALESIANGEMAATVFQDNKLMASWAIQQALIYINSPWIGTIDFNMPPILITKDNVGQFIQ
jgi:ribose transport system substrate-binding protein